MIGEGKKDNSEDTGDRDTVAVPSTFYGSVAVKKLHRILSDTRHPLNHVLSSQASRCDFSNRLRCLSSGWKKEREDRKVEPNTALRFQTRGRHQTPQPPFGDGSKQMMT